MCGTLSRMCYKPGARPPRLPDDLRHLPSIAGGALETRDLSLLSRDGTPFAAFAALPSGTSDVDVVIFPDMRGLTPFAEEVALRLAEAGAAAIVFDYFGRTNGPVRPGPDFDTFSAMMLLTEDQIAGDASAAARYLRDRGDAGIRRLVTLGFCAGGRHALLDAVPGSPLGSDGAIAFHPVLRPLPTVPAPIERAARMRGPILGLYGGSDEVVPLEEVRALDDALSRAGVDHEFHVYPGAPHGFFDPAGGFAPESEDAWRRVVTFLRLNAS